tara:strand:+ start:1150 stop:1371 length:222 start_codon:yes stop_codon:yes gene_type:complete
MKYLNIEHNGMIYTIYREDSECLNVFYKRAWYIATKNPQTQSEFENIEKLSYIWRNATINGMTYDEKIMKLIS